MPSASDRTRIVSQQAAYWYIRCADERAMLRSDRQLFYAWLKRSPENIAEILRMAEMDGKFSGRKLLDSVGQLEPSNVVDIGLGNSAAQYDYQPSNSVSDKVPRKSRISSRWGIAAAAAAVVLTILLGVAVLNGSREGVVETRASEWQHMALPDGSTVYLDARTRVKVEFTEDRRIVHLYHGWAVFDVAKDRTRPFTVRTDVADVTAVGTRFGVEIDHGVRTTVEEGTVAVKARDARGGSPVLVHQGQELHVPAVSTLMLSETDVVQVDARRKLQWVTGRVQLSDTTIGEIVRQFNRRQKIQADIEDPELAGRPVDLALMQVDNVDDFIEVMESRGVTVIRNGSTLTLRATRSD